MNTLSYGELETLKIIADPSNGEHVERGHLERLSRLNLIEPCDSGVCLSGKGRAALTTRK